jgi:hypothetical protein
MSYQIKSDHIIFPKSNLRVVLKIIGSLMLFCTLIGGMAILDPNNSGETEIALIIVGFLFCLSIFFLTFNKTAIISKDGIEIKWLAFFLPFRIKILSLSTFNTIFVQQQAFMKTNQQKYNTQTSNAYHITLANSNKYTLETTAVTPEIFPYIYHVNQHASFDVEDKNALENCKKLVEALAKITEFPIVCDEIMSEKLGR